MERDSCQRKYQYDVAVAGSTYYDVSAAIPGEFVALEFEPLNQYDSNAIAVVQNGHKLGHIPRGNIQQMIHDFNSRNEPVLALLSTINGSELTLSIGFYKSRLSELMNSGAKRKTFKLTGNRNADMQENLSFCSVGESVDACYDAEKGKYLASAGCDIGYFPASADDLLEGDFEAVIEELEENDDGKYSVSVTVYEA